MIQYLINLTGIWLLSLIVFDIFLRKESYHAYNRVYLLATMLAGIILPLISWQYSNRIYPVAVQRPVANVVEAKGRIVAVAQSAHKLSWEQWLLVLYITGVAITVSLLLKEVVKLISWYRVGKRSFQDGWTIVETGRGHAPFSFFNLLFINDKVDYSAEEWQLILQHERRHTTLRHFADLLLLQLSKIVFWFHPLVYIYSKRLLMVHEYQADNVGSTYPQVYGRFLVEQAVLHAAPSITHSFNRSPIKKRILMLTRTSSLIARSKMLVALPVALASVLCFSKTSFSQNANVSFTLVSAFGVTNTNPKEAHNTTYDKVLSAPRVVCNDPMDEVKEYDISFLPKGSEFMGPYHVTGADMKEKALAVIQKCKADNNPNTRIFIENIVVRHNGRDEKTNPVVMYCTP